MRQHGHLTRFHAVTLNSTLLWIKNADTVPTLCTVKTLLFALSLYNRAIYGHIFGKNLAKY